MTWNEEKLAAEFESRVNHARGCSTPQLESLLHISAERWAGPVAVVREERDIEWLRKQLKEAQS